MISPHVLQVLPPVKPIRQWRFGAVSLPGRMQTLMLLSGRQHWGDSQLLNPIGDTDLAALKCCAGAVAAVDDHADDLNSAGAQLAGAGVGD